MRLDEIVRLNQTYSKSILQNFPPALIFRYLSMPKTLLSLFMKSYSATLTESDEHFPLMLFVFCFFTKLTIKLGFSPTFDVIEQYFPVVLFILICTR